MFIQASKNNFANIDFVSDTRNVDLSSTESNAEMVISAVVPVSAGSQWRFRVRATNDANTFNGALTNTRFSGTISAIYIPCGANGTNVLNPA